MYQTYFRYRTCLLVACVEWGNNYESELDSGERGRHNIRMERICDPKEEIDKEKARSKRNHKFEARQTKPKTSTSYRKEVIGLIAARNAKQASAKKAATGVNGSARSASCRASTKAI